MTPQCVEEIRLFGVLFFYARPSGKYLPSAPKRRPLLSERSFFFSQSPDFIFAKMPFFVNMAPSHLQNPLFLQISFAFCEVKSVSAGTGSAEPDDGLQIFYLCKKWEFCTVHISTVQKAANLHSCTVLHQRKSPASGGMLRTFRNGIASAADRHIGRIDIRSGSLRSAVL